MTELQHKHRIGLVGFQCTLPATEPSVSPIATLHRKEARPTSEADEDIVAHKMSFLPEPSSCDTSRHTIWLRRLKTETLRSPEQVLVYKPHLFRRGGRTPFTMHSVMGAKICEREESLFMGLQPATLLLVCHFA